MAETRTRRRFTAEFKAQAVKRVLEGGKGLTAMATELGVGAGQPSTGRTEHLAAGSAAALAARKAEEAEMQRLKREASVNNGHRFSRSGSAAFPVTTAASRAPWSSASASAAPVASWRCSSKLGSRAAHSWNRGAKGPVGTSAARPTRSGDAA